MCWKLKITGDWTNQHRTDLFIIDRELIQGKFIDSDNNVLTVNWSRKKQCSAEK